LQAKPFRYIYLLMGLTGYLLLSPIVHQFFPPAVTAFVDGMILLILVFGVWTLLGSRTWLMWAGALAVGAVALYLVSAVTGVQAFRYASNMIVLVFCVGTAGIALRDVLQGGQIDSNRLIGAVCVYLLMGVIWAILFSLVNIVSPDPGFQDFATASETQEADAFLYYSFVTLTTLGYGDISPVTPIGRTLAYMEAIVGQLYLTILVASLVGMIKPSNWR